MSATVTRSYPQRPGSPLARHVAYATPRDESLSRATGVTVCKRPDPPSLDPSVVRFVDEFEGEETCIVRDCTHVGLQMERFLDQNDVTAKQFLKQMADVAKDCTQEMQLKLRREARIALFYVAYRNLHYPTNRAWKPDSGMMQLVRSEWGYCWKELCTSPPPSSSSSCSLTTSRIVHK